MDCRVVNKIMYSEGGYAFKVFQKCVNLDAQEQWIGLPLKPFTKEAIGLGRDYAHDLPSLEFMIY